jgi:alpha-beta hydrolase superfamily lysophospholipase
VIEYPDAHHTLEFEPDPRRYAQDLIDWLDQHCAADLVGASRAGP